MVGDKKSVVPLYILFILLILSKLLCQLCSRSKDLGQDIQDYQGDYQAG